MEDFDIVFNIKVSLDYKENLINTIVTALNSYCNSLKYDDKLFKKECLSTIQACIEQLKNKEV